MLAHLVERFYGIEEVRSSNLLHSTNSPRNTILSTKVVQNGDFFAFSSLLLAFFGFLLNIFYNIDYTIFSYF